MWALLTEARARVPTHAFPIVAMHTVYSRTLQHVRFAGRAMYPILDGTQQPLDLAVRVLQPCSADVVFPGDIVMYKRRTESGALHHYIRRITAVEGEDVESADTSEAALALQTGECWLSCDEAAEGEPDSRDWGPIALRSISGRVVLGRGHGARAVFPNNSELGTLLDSVVFEEARALLKL